MRIASAALLIAAGCSSGGGAGDGGIAHPDAVSPADAAVTDDATTSDAAVTDDAAPQGPAAEAGVDALADGGVTDAGTDGRADYVRGPVWAGWPMPNPPDSGFPNPASYETSTPGVVLDKVTGLMWQESDALSTAVTIAEAAGECAALRLAGYSDWRLPSRVELWSIADFMTLYPSLDPVFSTMASDSRPAIPWTTTPSFDGYKYGGTYFGGGDGGPTDRTSQSVDPWYLSAAAGGGVNRCVRGSTAQPSPHYTVLNGTVLDHGTGLTWQQGYDPVPSLPNGVASYCASLALAGGGWRGPSVKELETLVDDTLVAPALDTSVFQVPPNAINSVQDVNDLVFYSDAPWEHPNSGARYVDFLNGEVGGGENVLPLPPIPSSNNLFQVRCVR